jgi:hypothetical protein
VEGVVVEGWNGGVSKRAAVERGNGGKGRRTDLLAGGTARLQGGPDRVALGAQGAGEEGGACSRCVLDES